MVVTRRLLALGPGNWYMWKKVKPMSPKMTSNMIPIRVFLSNRGSPWPPGLRAGGDLSIGGDGYTRGEPGREARGEAG